MDGDLGEVAGAAASGVTSLTSGGYGCHHPALRGFPCGRYPREGYEANEVQNVARAELHGTDIVG